MKVIKNLPFYRNTPDNTHCFQASLMMILGYFMPQREFLFEELDKISAKKFNLWTWPTATLIWMQENGFDVIDIEYFDYKKFIKEGGDYLLELFGKEMGEAQIRNSDIEQERRLSLELLEKVTVQAAIPSKETIFALMDDGYVIGVNVNSAILNGKSGYSGHFVIIKGYDKTGFILNDPGLPGEENKKVPFTVFEEAWAYPNEKAKNIIAFRLKQ